MTTRVRASILAITFGAFVSIPAIAAAQSPATIGVKGGVNLAKLHFDNAADNADVKTLIGAVGGVFVGKSISDMVGVRVEGLFSQKGAKNAETGVDDAKFKLTYVDVPVLLTLGPASSGDTRFNVFTGPQMSFKTKAEATFLDQTEDLSDEVRGTDFGWVLGVGLEKGRVTADARYTLGLKDISKDNSKVKNRVIAVMLGVKLK